MPCKKKQPKNISFSWYCPMCCEDCYGSRGKENEDLATEAESYCSTLKRKISIKFKKPHKAEYSYYTPIRRPESGEPYQFYCLRCGCALHVEWGRKLGMQLGLTRMKPSYNFNNPNASQDDSLYRYDIFNTIQARRQQLLIGNPTPGDNGSNAFTKKKYLKPDQFGVECFCGAYYRGRYEDNHIVLTFDVDETAVYKEYERREDASRAADCKPLEDLTTDQTDDKTSS